MPKAITELKVFLASPSDVSAERSRARQILQIINEAVGESRGIHLKAIGWEDVSPDLGDPQALINRFSAGADLVVVLFHRRFGSPTAHAASGTLEEFLRARESWQARGTPRVMLFFKEVDPASLADPGAQLQQVLQFRRAFESDRTGLFHTFSEIEDFATRFQQHLLHWLEEVQPTANRNRSDESRLHSSSSQPDPETKSPGTLKERIKRIRQAAHDVFSPGTPVLFPPFLALRGLDLGRIDRAIHTPGKSIVLYGPPASGKTSLLEMLKKRVNAFYRSAGRGYTWTMLSRTILEALEPEGSQTTGSELRRRLGRPPRATPDEAAERLQRVSQLVIVDDFDKVEIPERLHFTELIKKLSNRRAQLTLLLAGRATKIEELIPDYEEIQPQIQRIELPKLSPADLARIVELGFESLGIEVDTAARAYILAQSDLPHTVHQYCLDCVYALEDRILEGAREELVIGREECEMAERPTVG